MYVREAEDNVEYACYCVSLECDIAVIAAYVAEASYNYFVKDDV